MGLDPAAVAQTSYDTGYVMPWEHISTGVSTRFLAHERKKAAAEKTTPDCTFERCAACGACPGLGIDNQLAQPRIAGGSNAPPANRLAKRVRLRLWKPSRPQADSPPPVRKPPRKGSSMAEQQTFRMRITFAKQGRLALLSHLEVARAIERAVRRAQLPFAVSQGFSPHMKIAFGAALPVGVGGTHEMVDLQLLRYVRPEEALLVLQKESVPDLMVKECVYIEPKAPAASAAFPLSTYRALLSAAPAQLPVPEQVHIIRKKKEKVLDVADFLVGDMLLEGASLTFTLEQKPTGSLRPDKLLAACLDQVNVADDQEQEVPLAFLVDNAWTQSIEPPADGQPLRVPVHDAHRPTGEIDRTGNAPEPPPISHPSGNGRRAYMQGP